MRKIWLFSCLILVTAEINAQGACDIFGPNDITCQSEKLMREIEPEIRAIERKQKRDFDMLLFQCQNGNQNACNRLNVWMNTPVPKEPYMQDRAKSFGLGGN